MPTRARPRAVYNTPTIRNGGFGVLQIEAIHNRPLSIARRHLAASELRMRGIEPNELSSSQWVRFLVMETPERERWINQFLNHRRNSNDSNSSVENDRETAQDKAEEARLEAEEAAREEQRALAGPSAPAPPFDAPPPPIVGLAEASSSSSSAPSSHGRTPSVSIWARQFDEVQEGDEYSARRPRHARRAVTDGIIEAPPTYDAAVRSRTPPPAYEPRSDDEELGDTSHSRRIRFA